MIGSQSLVLGGDAYAAICAVEGLKLSADSKARLADIKNLTPDQRRCEIIRFYKNNKKEEGR